MAFLTDEDYRRHLAAVVPVDAADAARLLRYYRTGPPTKHTAPKDYDDRLAARVPETVLAEVVAFAFGYFVAHGHKYRSPASVQVVREDMIRAWELATGKTAGLCSR